MVYTAVLEAVPERVESSSLSGRTKTLPNTRSIIGQVVCFQVISSKVERCIDIAHTADRYRYDLPNIMPL